MVTVVTQIQKGVTTVTMKKPNNIGRVTRVTGVTPKYNIHTIRRETMKISPLEIDPESGIHVLLGRIYYNGPECCQIAIYCPFCRRNHFHGWPSRSIDPNLLEHRLCHCHDKPNRCRTESPFYGRGYLIGVDPNAKSKPCS